ncbi:hypothetical protein [methane-oxidizing endosymbiont of Gigantopelta aegis]|uniref:hypothetical protein n=1 Tax=methane-oxidizing endosymbiont of Gigantopelta aegis TaxID=2794938 RepID=UPI0018DB51EA|nr:hypothetical protein [methane-oxidizing endosymbiont of Gigantopelta aegis]
MKTPELNRLLSLKKGIKITHMAILAVSILVASFLFTGNKIALFEESIDYELTRAILQAIEEQNKDKQLEYAESKPIIKSLKKPLRDFEYNLYRNRTRALGYLTIIKQRFKYLRYKDLDTSAAENILRNAADQANLSSKNE